MSISPRTDPSLETLLRGPRPTTEAPLRLLLSACLLGNRCTWDGDDCGNWPLREDLLQLPNVRPAVFCPEDAAFGTPRALSNIHGGDGFDVLDGRARVLTEDGEDWTEAMVAASRRMLEVARAASVQLAILLDVSAACGLRVIYDGHRTGPAPKHRRGPGVAAALLLRNGVPVLAQRDFASLDRLLCWLDPVRAPDPGAIDHADTAWYRAHLDDADEVARQPR